VLSILPEALNATTRRASLDHSANMLAKCAAERVVLFERIKHAVERAQQRLALDVSGMAKSRSLEARRLTFDVPIIRRRAPSPMVAHTIAPGARRPILVLAFIELTVGETMAHSAPPNTAAISYVSALQPIQRSSD